jgi:hypothetical protein
MAQITEFIAGADKRTAIKEALMSVHDFVRIDEDTTKLYFDENSYIQLEDMSSAEMRVYLVSPNISQYFNVNNNYYVRIVKSASGDVTFQSNSGVIEDSEHYRFSLIKCKSGVTGVEKWALHIPQTAADGAYFHTAFILEDGTINVTNAVRIVADTTSSQYLYCGYNPQAKMVMLMPMCALNSEYVSQNTYLMHFTPRPYNSDTIIGGKHYYCIGFLAMLDE